MRPDPQKTLDLVTFTKEILHRKLHFLHSGCFSELRTFVLKNCFIIMSFHHRRPRTPQTGFELAQNLGPHSVECTYGFETVQNLSSHFVECSQASFPVVITTTGLWHVTTTPWCYLGILLIEIKSHSFLNRNFCWDHPI